MLNAIRTKIDTTAAAQGNKCIRCQGPIHIRKPIWVDGRITSVTCPLCISHEEDDRARAMIAYACMGKMVEGDGD